MNTIQQAFTKLITNNTEPNNVKKYLHIIIKFKNYDAKIDLLKKKRAAGKVFVNQLYPKSMPAGSEIFIQERLTPYNSDLLRKLNGLKNSKTIAYSWFRHGRVYARIKESDPTAVLISSQHDIDRLKNTIN